MTQDLEQLAARLAARARRAAWWSECARWSAPALFAIGAVVFAARAFADAPRTSAALALGAFALVPLVAAWRARTRGLSAAGAVAWLDRASGGTGELLTQFDVGDERWRESARAALARVAALPRLAPARIARDAAPSLLAAAFVAGALWVSPPAPAGLPPTHLAESALERVEEQLAALLEVVELPPEKADELTERLQRVAEGIEDAPLDASLEALDRTGEQLAAEAERGLASAERAGDELARADAAQSAGEAQAAIEQALRELREGGLAAKLPETLQAQLAAGTLELPEGVQLSGEAALKLSSEMRTALEARLGTLARSGLITPKQLARATAGRVSDHVCDEQCKRGGT